jgi:hypothetical protein
VAKVAKVVTAILATKVAMTAVTKLVTAILVHNGRTCTETGFFTTVLNPLRLLETEPGFLPNLRAIAKYFRKNPVSAYPCVQDYLICQQQNL